jgi:acyl-CoA synthetase (AMP-forming)/AMP-acid ligase II
VSRAFDAAVAELTGPGAPFELETVESPAGPVRTFARRERSIRELIDRAARRGDVPFVVQGDRRLSFGEFGGLVRGTSRVLRDAFGLERGDRVAVVGANSIDWLLAVFGAAGAGIVAAVLNQHWATDELAFAIADSGARMVFADAELAGRMADLPTKVGTLERVVPLGSVPVEPAEVWPAVPIDEADPFVLMYTSGTTGRPKGCITTHQGTLAQVRAVMLNGRLDRQLAVAGKRPPLADGPRRQTALLVTSPLFHVSGLHAAICLSLAAGTKVVFPAGRFDPAEVLRIIEEERITAWGGVPTMIHRVVDCPDIQRRDLSSLESVAIGGAPLPPDVLARAQKTLGAKASLGNGYGLTETHGAVTMNAGRGLVQRPTSVGRPSPVVDLRIVGEDGEAVPSNEVGEIQVRGVTVTPGYWNRPEDNAAAFADGWFRTGDAGSLDADGFLHLADRLKDMVIRGGENIAPVEVEDALGAHPDVDEVAVFGLADPDLGERVAAVVVLVPGGTADEVTLRDFLVGRLARYKVPDRVVVATDPLPRNATGKILKAELRARHGAVPARGE